MAIGDTGFTASGTINSVSYVERPGSGKVTMSEGRATGRRVFLVDWASKDNFITGLCGSVRVIDNTVVRTFGEQFPGWPGLFCTRAAATGKGRITDDDGDPSYTYAEIEAIYEPVTYARDSKGQIQVAATEAERLLGSEELAFSAEFLEYPTGGLKWGSKYYAWEQKYDWGGEVLIAAEGATDEAKPVMQNAVFQVPVAHYTYMVKGLEELHLPIIHAALGGVNKATFRGIEPGCLLVAGVNARREITTEGKQPYEVVVTLSHRKYPWNSLFNPAQQAFVEITPHPYRDVDIKGFFESIIGEGLEDEDFSSSSSSSSSSHS